MNFMICPGMTTGLPPGRYCDLASLSTQRCWDRRRLMGDFMGFLLLGNSSIDEIKYGYVWKWGMSENGVYPQL